MRIRHPDRPSGSAPASSHVAPTDVAAGCLQILTINFPVDFQYFPVDIFYQLAVQMYNQRSM